MRLIGCLVALPALTLSACGGTSDASSTAVVRDSAGITIVENAAPAWGEGEGFTSGGDPLVDIGMLDGPAEYQLFRAADAVRLSDGRIVIANGGTSELRYYDESGVHIRSVGRQGAGPGEFQGISWIDVAGNDSLLAYDSQLRRISLFDPSGTFVDSRTVQSLTSEGAQNVVARFADGTFLLQGIVQLDPTNIRTGLHRFPSVLSRSVPGDSSGAAVDSLGVYPGMESMVIIGDNSIGIMRGGFMRRLELQAGDSAFVAGTQNAYEVEVRPISGAPRMLIRWNGGDLALTPDVISRYREQQLERATDRDERAATQRRLDEMTYPDAIPAYGSLVLDALGNIWVQEFQRDDETENRWNVFDPNGRMLGGVVLPQGLKVYQIGEDFVLGQWTDDLDVEHVRSHRLVRGKGKG